MELSGDHSEARGDGASDHDEGQKGQDQAGEGGNVVGREGHGLGSLKGPARRPRPVIRGIGAADGEHPLPLLHEALLRNVDADNRHYKGVILLARHLSEQYFTSSQTRSHLRRQVKGRLQVTHTLVGKSPLRVTVPRLTWRAMAESQSSAEVSRK